MDELDPYEFEHFVANLWEAKGYDTTVTSGSRDRGIDFEAEKLGRKEVVQVKKYGPDNKVGSQEVRNYATLYQQVPDANTVVLVTSSSFTEQAEELADDLKVEIFDRQRLTKELETYDVDANVEIPQPRSENVDTPQHGDDFDRKGVVTFFNSVGEYGFIAAEGMGDDEVFFHMEDLDGDALEEGEKVGIDVEDTAKGPQTRNVVRLDDAVEVDVEPNRGDSGCFIATAAYGTSTADEIDVLRALRDEKLRGNILGELFITGYYSVSPPIAEYIEKREHRQRVVREWFVQPLVDTVRRLR